MADNVVDFPPKSGPALEEKFEFEEGTVTIRSSSNEPVSVYEAIAMIEGVKFLLLKTWVER